MKTKFIFSILFFVTTVLYSQTKYNFLVGMDLSYTGINSTPYGITPFPLLNNLIVNNSVALQLRPNNYYSFELGYQIIEFADPLFDHKYLDRNPQSETSFLYQKGPRRGSSKLAFDIWYSSIYLTASGYIPFGETERLKENIYLSAGLSYNSLIGHIGNTRSFTDPYNGELLQFSFDSNKQYIGGVIEVGYNYNYFYLGFRYNTAFQKIFNGTYTDSLNGQVIQNVNMTGRGEYFGLVGRVTFGTNDLKFLPPTKKSKNRRRAGYWNEA